MECIEQFQNRVKLCLGVNPDAESPWTDQKHNSWLMKYMKNIKLIVFIFGKLEVLMDSLLLSKQVKTDWREGRNYIKLH